MKKFFKYSWMLVLPAVVAVAVVWKSSAQTWGGGCPPVDLGYTVLLPNPADCSTFFSCSDGVPILMNCPDGLHFNDELDVCDWPQDAGCWEIHIDLELGTCGWSDGIAYVCGISKTSTEVLRALVGGNWCCDSCGSSSYCAGRM